MKNDEELQVDSKDQITRILIFLTELKTEFKITMDNLKSDIKTLKENESEVQNLRKLVGSLTEIVNSHTKQFDAICEKSKLNNNRIWDFLIKHGLSLILFGYIIFQKVSEN
jgi:hypothetical protein